MANDVTDAADEEPGYYSLSEEHFHLLPKELRSQFEAMAADGRTILDSVEKELDRLTKISTSMATLASLRYIYDRLSKHQFSPDEEWMLELDMLTTAFLVTYVRLHQGKAGSGFDRSHLPEHLRAKHDEVLELRNKRFAHTDFHPSVRNMMEISFKDGVFIAAPSLSLGYFVGGATEWKELVESVEAIYYDQKEKLMARLTHKTAYQWKLIEGPPPDDAG
jgi:hypothetical protein